MINCVINELLDNEYPGRLSQYTMIFVLAGFLDAQDPRTSKHSRRVSIYSSVIGCRLNLSDEDKSTLRLAGLLHDIGKIGVQRALLHKPDRLTPDEINEIRKHAMFGYKILAEVPELANVANFVLYHHERIDGKGYPHGLAGKKYPWFQE